MCVRASSGILRKGVLLLLPLLILVFTVTGCIAVVVMFGLLFHFGRDWAPLAFLGGPALAVLKAGAVIILYISVRAILRSADLPADVAFYIGRPTRRKELQTGLLDLVGAVRRRLAGGRIVVCAHSLGTVLAVQTLTKLSTPPSVNEPPIMLLTLGSPLVKLSQWFAGTINGPEEMARQFATLGTVARWTNLWQQHDYIGKRLSSSASPFLVEQEVGSGGHGGYLALQSVWKHILEFAEHGSDGRPPE